MTRIHIPTARKNGEPHVVRVEERWTVTPHVLYINDNVIDVEITPGKVGEAPESVTWRPHVAP